MSGTAFRYTWITPRYKQGDKVRVRIQTKDGLWCDATVECVTTTYDTTGAAVHSFKCKLPNAGGSGNYFRVFRIADMKVRA